MRRVIPISCLLAIAALGGCAQSNAALELASKTNAAVLSVKIQIEEFSATQRRIALIEAARMGDFRKSTFEIDAAFAEIRDELLRDESGLLQVVPGRAAKILENEAEPVKEAAALRQGLQQRLKHFAPPSEAIDALSADLTVLGEEKSFGEKVDFFVSFGQSVKEAIDRAKAERDKALKNAAKTD